MNILQQLPIPPPLKEREARVASSCELAESTSSIPSAFSLQHTRTLSSPPNPPTAPSHLPTIAQNIGAFADKELYNTPLLGQPLCTSTSLRARAFSRFLKGLCLLRTRPTLNRFVLAHAAPFRYLICCACESYPKTLLILSAQTSKDIVDNH